MRIEISNIKNYISKSVYTCVFTLYLGRDIYTMTSIQDPTGTYVQLSKPYFTLDEIDFMINNNKDLSHNIKNFKQKSRDVFQVLIKLIIKLKLPIKILQNSSYFYQKFYILNNNYKKYSNLHFEVGLACLFISLKLNDFIKKINVVISEALSIKEFYLTNNDVEDNKKIIISLERKILEFQSFDFRNFLIEDYLIKFLKYYNESTGNTSSDLLGYLSWSLLNDLYLTSLILQYPAHYNAIICIKASTLLLNELKSDFNLNIDFKKSFPMVMEIDSFNINGVNQLFGYLIDNLGITFFKSSLKELNIIIDDKKLTDLLINIKIELNNQIKSTDKQTNRLDKDLFFQPRNTDIAKNGSLRFLYNKQTYLREIDDKNIIP